jgi:hypothetical protein
VPSVSGGFNDTQGSMLFAPGASALSLRAAWGHRARWFS